MPAKLKYGVIGAPGGKRPGAGRPTDKFLEEVEKIGDPLEVVRFYYDVAKGKELEQVVTDSGETVRVAASVKDRLRAGELYLDRRIGKVPQPIDVKQDDDEERPATDVLIQTVTVLRAELDRLRGRTQVAERK